MIVRGALFVALLAFAGGATAAGVTLPSKANSHAVDSTSSVSTDASVHASEAPEPEGSASADAHATFGQCVAANAQTASENGGQGWNPTVGCDNTNASANGNASSETGLTAAGTHANSHASTGLDKASAGANNAPAH